MAAREVGVVVVEGEDGAAASACWQAAADTGCAVVRAGDLERCAAGDVGAAAVLSTLCSRRAVRALRRAHGDAFVAVVSAAAADEAALRWRLFEAGANMVTARGDDLRHVLALIVELHQSAVPCSGGGVESGQRVFSCPYCSYASTEEDHLWHHMPLFHIHCENRRTDACPVCGESSRKNMMVHVHNAHGPAGRGQHPSEFAVKPLPLYAFALVVCRRPDDGRYLLVQEFAQCGYWVPGGRVDGSEDLYEAARRETLEEAGVEVRITGVLQVQYSPADTYARLRVVLMAEPVHRACPPKGVPDYESAGAVWVPPRDVLADPPALVFRGSEPVTWVRYVESGGVVHPLSVLRSSER